MKRTMMRFVDMYVAFIISIIRWTAWFFVGLGVFIGFIIAAGGLIILKLTGGIR